MPIEIKYSFGNFLVIIIYGLSRYKLTERTNELPANCKLRNPTSEKRLYTPQVL